jgi:hypothetical protein
MAFTAPIFIKLPISQQNYVQISCTEFYLNRASNMKSISTISMAVTEPILFYEAHNCSTVSVSVSYTKFHKNPAHGSIADSMLQTDRRTDVVPK